MADAAAGTASKKSATKYTRKRRNPSKVKKSKNNVLLHRKSNFKAQLDHCQKLLDKGEPEIVLHALGAAINRAVNMALQLETNAKGLVKLHVDTSSVDLIDDLEPLLDDIEPQSQNKKCSAIHIKVKRITANDILENDKPES